MINLGIIEGFFGPQWPDEARLSYAKFLSEFGGRFYIYAPKQDPYLRKKWREDWNSEYLAHLTSLISTFHKEGIHFGVGFSPFGLGTSLNDEDKNLLIKKVKQMSSLGIDVLGLFFDDMPVNDNLAKTQIETLDLIQNHFSKKIIFCPSYYTPDPILDKVFGQRPENYLEEIADGVPSEVAIAWTGPKVISPVIDGEHLEMTGKLLKRPPFLWENLFANDGPKNCKFLKLKPFSGRDNRTLELSEGIGLNMMNQPELSKILYLSSKLVLEGELPETGYQNALIALCSEGFRKFLKSNGETLLTRNLDNITAEEKESFINELKQFPDVAAVEIIDWLNGQYNVGSECLTD